MFSLPTTAHAQAMSAEEAAALRAELEALRAQVETLEARVDQASPPPAAAPTQAPPTASAVKWQGAPETSTASGWHLEPRGRRLIAPGSAAAPAASYSTA